MRVLQRMNAIPDLGGRGVEFYRNQIGRFTRYEQVLALLLMGIPCLLLMFGDNTPLTTECSASESSVGCRDSISAFYDMAREPLFSMPLTIAAFMFFSNAVLRNEHWWNAFAGLALAGLVLFDHDDFDLVHGIFATAFFLITMLTVAWYLPKDLTGTTGIRIPITLPRAARTTAIFGAQILLFLIVKNALNLFVAEAVQLWIVGGHYILHSIKHAEFDDLTRSGRTS